MILFLFLGSPLVVSLIGALLRDFPNRWAYYLRQLQIKQFKRIRKSSSYDYEALDEAMSISVDMLREDIKGYYTDLSILKKDVKVPTKVIEGPVILIIGYLFMTRHTESIVAEDIENLRPVWLRGGAGGC